MSHPKWDMFGEQGGSPVAAAAAWMWRGGMRRKAWEKGAAQQAGDGSLLGKPECPQKALEATDRDSLHPRGKRIAWVTAMHKTHWNRSTGNKPLGNAPFLLELGRGLVGARVPVYKPFYNNWRGFAEGICILVCGKNNPLEIRVPFDALSVFSGKSLDPST